jgi:RHS repeat-associated protein
VTIDQDYGIPDSLNRKLLRDVKVGGNTISHEGYGYDPNRPGLLTSVERDDNKRDIFHYDLLPELDWAHYGVPTGGGAAQREVGYEWDKAGNREGVSDNGAYTNYTPVGNQLNQYLQVGIDTVTNGNEHEIAVYQNINYTYINDTRLSLVSGPDLLGQQTNYQLNYDALGRTVVRILNGVPTYYIYDGEKPILEYQGGWTQPLASNVYGKGIDEILMRTDYSLPTEQRPYYYQSDHEGSITHLIDTNGNVLETYRYDAFGKPTINGGALTASALNNRFMFTGREYVPQFGIYEYRARAYHPGLGRFMSEDPKLFDAGDYNLFRYCHNDPLDLTDPMGLLAGFDRYRLVYDPRQQHDATHDGWSVQGVPGTESKSGGVHLEVDRSVTRSERIANSDKGGDTKSSFTADKKGGEATIHLQIDVRYATKAGDFTRAKAESSEWQHSTDAVNEGNRIRGLYAGRVGGLSAEAAVALIRNGDRRGPMSTWTAPLKGPFGYETKLFRESYNRWDSLDAARMRGEKVAPHTPVDPVTGEPVPWNR